MKWLSCCFLTLALSGCASGYTEFYRPVQGTTPEMIASHRANPPPTIPLLDRSGDQPQTVLATYQRAGYAAIGYSSFNSGQPQWESGALAQGTKVGADVVVVISPRYTGSRSSVIPMTMPTSQTSYTTGSATAYGASGPVTMTGSATTTTYGSQTTYIPITINRYDYGAIYFVKRKFVLGVNWRELNDAERQEVQTNKGFYVTSLVSGSPAFEADVLPGDIVLEIDGQTASSLDGYLSMIDAHKGETINLTIFRNGKKMEKSVGLAR